MASSQVRTLEMQHISHEKETQSLRQQLIDFQMQTDEKTIIGEISVLSVDSCICKTLWQNIFISPKRKQIN